MSLKAFEVAYFQTPDESSTFEVSDKFLKYAIHRTLLLITVFIFSYNFRIWCVSRIYLYITGELVSESALSENDDVGNLHNQEHLITSVSSCSSQVTLTSCCRALLT